MTYTDLQLDGLKEIINIGGGHAATSISMMVNRKIVMRVPEVEILSYEKLYQQLLAENEEVYAVVSQILGDVRGVFLFVLTNPAADKMTEFMVGTTEFDEEVKASAVNELTNIVSNSFLGAIGKFLGNQLISSLPIIQYDYFGAIISSVYMALNQFDDHIMVIRNEFTYDEDRLEASLFFIPETGGIEKILTTLGI
jgi:chemotaxis protein CheC